MKLFFYEQIKWWWWWNSEVSFWAPLSHRVRSLGTEKRII